MTFNTGNPIGSTDARDRLDNTENMDYLENSTTELTHPDRLGNVRKTRHGMEAEHDAQISAHEVEHDAQISAHEVEHDNQMQSFESDFDGRLAGMASTRVGSFTAGATLTDMRQVLVWEVSQGGDGHEYGWSGAFPKVVAAGATPATSGGIGAGAWVDRSADTLKDILMSDSGAENIGSNSGYSVQTEINNLKSSAEAVGSVLSQKIDEHNTSPSSHPQLSEFISQEADRAETAADAATISARVYGSAALGITGTTTGDYFTVLSPTSANYLDLYLNNAGVAEYKKSYPSTIYINEIEDVFNKNTQLTALEVQASNGDVVARFDSSGFTAPAIASQSVNTESLDGVKSVEQQPNGNSSALSYQSANGDEIASIGRGGVKAENAKLKRLRSSDDRKFFIDGDLIPASVMSSGRGLRSVNHVLLIGRSLAAGRGNIRYTQPRFNTLTGFGRNSIVGQADPCAANVSDLLNNTMFDISNVGTEKFHHFAVDHCLTLLKRKKNVNPSVIEPRFLTSVVALGGRTITTLSNNTLSIINLHIQSAKQRVEEMGYTYNFAGIINCHLDGDGEDNAQPDGFAYKSAMLQYFNAIRGFAESATGRAAKSIPVFNILQPNSNYFGSLAAEGNLAYYELSKEDENIFVSSTTNMCEGQEADFPGTGLLHKSGVGTLSAAANCGRGMYRYFFENGDANGLKPVSVTAINNVILVKLNKGNLFIPTTTHNGSSYFSKNTKNGFVISNKPFGYLDGGISHSEISISNVEVFEDTVKITAASTIPSGYKLYCLVSDISSKYDQTMYADQSTNGETINPFDTLIDFVEDIITYA